MKGPRFWAAATVTGVAIFLASFALRPLDMPVGESIVGTPGLVFAAGALALLGGVSFVGPAVVVGCIVLARRRRWWGFTRLVGATLLSEAVSRTLKSIFARPRPEYALLEAGGYSFPSGHATLGAAVAMLLVWFTGRYIKGRAYIVAALAVALAWAIAVAASRMVLGVHYLSDVVGGMGVGIAISSGVILTTVLSEESVARKKAVEAGGARGKGEVGE